MMNINSVYTALANLATFNNLVEAGLVRFLSAKEEKEAKTVTVNLKDLQEARKQAEKALAAARAIKGYHAAVVAKKAVKASRRIFAGLGRKVKGLAVMSLQVTITMRSTSMLPVLVRSC